MFITLTNASPEFRGRKFAIKRDLVVSIYENTVTRDDELQTVEDVTFIYAPPHGTWQVSETLEKVVEMLK